MSNTTENNTDNNESKASRNRRRRKKKQIRIGVNIILLIAIIGVVIFSVVKLGLWNIGRKVDVSDVDSSAYDVEVLDQIFLQNQDDLAGHEDDGKETILCLGNNAFTDERGTDSGLAEMIADRTGATVYNAAFPDSTVAIKNSTFDSEYPMDMFSFFYTATFIASNDFSAMEQQASLMDNAEYTQSVDTLKSIDFNSVDMIVMMYDAQDYINGNTCYDPDNDMNPQTYAGAYDSGIKAIHEKYPFIRIVAMSHTYCLTTDEDGNILDADREDLGNGKLSTYLIKLIDVCEDCGVTMIDNYYGTIDADNYKDYLVDNTHINDKARKHIANHFYEVLFKNSASGEENAS